jgi:hypothetical protein
MSKDKTQRLSINKNYIQKSIENSVELAFISLSSDLGDHLHDFELLQISSTNNCYSKKDIDQLANKIDLLLSKQIKSIIYELQEEIRGI